VLEEAQTALHDDVLEDRSRGNIDGLALGGDNDDGTLESDATVEGDIAGDGQVVELNHLGDRGDTLLEVGHLLEVAAELDQRSITEPAGAHLELAMLDRVKIRLDKHQVRAGLDGQEAPARYVDAVGIFEVADSSTNSSLELEDRDVGLALLITRDGLAIGDDFHLELVILNYTLDGLEVHPDVVGVEVLELLDGLELVDVLLGNLSNLEKSDRALVVNDGTTLDIGLGLVGQLHNVLGIALNHVLQNTEIDNGTQVVSVRQENNLNTTLKQLVKDARVIERLEDVTVSGRIPVVDRRVKVSGHGKKGVLVNSWVARLVEREDVNVVTFVLLDDGSSVIVGIERVHQDEGHVRVVCPVEVLDLADRHVKEGHAIADFDDRLGADATHGGTQTTVELQDGELVEEADGLRVRKVLVINDLALGRRGNTIPVDSVALGLVIEIATEQREEVVHLSLEELLLLGVSASLSELSEPVAHLSSGHIGGGVLESLYRISAVVQSRRDMWLSM